MVLITKIKKYIGSSTDTKPIADVPPGSRFLETDTNAVYIYTGTDWELLTAVNF